MVERWTFWQRHAERIVALAAMAVLYWAARLPEVSDAERAALARRFAFTHAALPSFPGRPQLTERRLRPELRKISGWMSALGASVALSDLDGDGKPNDVCVVDPRLNAAYVAPLPGTGDRFPPFLLDPRPLPYDEASTAPSGCLAGDFNEDGLMDVLVYYWGRSPILFLHRDEPGASAPAPSSFRPVELVAGAPGDWYTEALTSADVDGDGHLDLIVGNYFRDGSELLSPQPTRPSEMQHSMSHARNGGHDRLFLWTGGGAGAQPQASYRDASDAFDELVANAWTLAIGAADLDGDMLPELYFANDFGQDRLLHNRSTPGHPRFVELEGERGFLTPKSKALGHDSFKGMGVDIADVNGDGWLDIYVSNIAQPFALIENHFVWISTGHPERMAAGVAPYVDRSEALGLARSAWSWDARFADFDNDGVPEAMQASGFLRGSVNRWPELQELAFANDNIMANSWWWPAFRAGDDLSGDVHDPFFVRASSGRYVDVAPLLGLGAPQMSRGIAIGDVDRDGREDVVLANQWQDSFFLHNQSPAPGAFLGLELRLPVEIAARPARTRPAIGAVATVWLPDGRRLVGQIDGGTGHSGKRAPEMHFGLGSISADALLRVDLRWRDSRGALHAETVQLRSGWHTLLLGDGVRESGKES